MCGVCSEAPLPESLRQNKIKSHPSSLLVSSRLRNPGEATTRQATTQLVTDVFPVTDPLFSDFRAPLGSQDLGDNAARR